MLLLLWCWLGKGTFLLSEGGLADNGAWSVGFGFQFGAAQKSYNKNFAQSTHATFSGKIY